MVGGCSPTPLPGPTGLWSILPSFATSKAYEPAASVFFGSAILNSVSVALTEAGALVVVGEPVEVVAWVVVASVVDSVPPAASADLLSLAMKITAAIIPTNSTTQATRKTRRPRPGNCGYQRGTSIDTISEKPAKPRTASPSPIFCPTESPSSSTAGT